jgi:FtsP/CotA-like multicopper oxidase with cupredoxin domain
MTDCPSGRFTCRGTRLAAATLLFASALAPATPAVEATTGVSPYEVPQVVDVNPDPMIVETTIVADETTVDFGGVSANALTFNGTVPGPEFRLTPGQRVIVHFENHLDSEVTGIHWHGIELANNSDGTPLTQNQVEPGDSYLYDFVAPRAGVYWYHPHHHASTNQVFKGLYGSIIITDPNEAALIADGTLPGAADTLTLSLSDVTVCKAPGANDAATFDSTLPWVGGGPLPLQSVPFPTTLCDTPVDDHGDPIVDGAANPIPLAAGDIPNVQKNGPRTNEGQIVLTNGMNVGGRAGDPSVPGALAGNAITYDVLPGQGLRLQIGNAATTRFFRLRLTDSTGAQIPLVRVGGEGGLLDDAVLDGTQPAGFEFKYPSGEILLDPGDRADVVAAIPDTATGVATLWTQDFLRTGGGDTHGGWTRTPTVPVAHLNVTGAPIAPAYTISAGTPLRSATGDPQEVLGAATGTLLDPATFVPIKLGTGLSETRLTAGAFPGIDGHQGTHDFSVDYTVQLHEASSRYAKLGDTLELQVRNMTNAHHPFHLHGFSIQPLTFTGCPGAVTSFTFPEPEFMDNLDIPPGCTLTYRIHLVDRPMVDGVTPGGGLGRWMLHCHIFFHHSLGMVSELVVVDAATGNEKPYVDADLPSITANDGDALAMTGTYMDPDGDAVTLNASAGTIVDEGGGIWSWSHTADGPTTTISITATDPNGNQGQTAFLVESTNIAPTVTIDPNQILAIDEGDPLNVAATFVDPGDDDPYTATIDYGDGSGPQAVTPTLTNPAPPQAGTVSGSFQYGDNGTFTVSVTVTDEDGASGSANFDVTVSNLDPDAIIGNTAPVMADINVPIAFDGALTDPGSDDLASTWTFDDGSPNSFQNSLVNPPATDPLPSPSVEPRAVDHDAIHAFTLACAYDVGFGVLDDDAGGDSESILVIVTAAPSLSRGAGYWQKQYGRQGVLTFSQPQLQCYLDIAAALSGVFNEVRSAATIPLAFNSIFVAGLKGDMREQLDRQILTAWVNFANGSVELNELLDTNNNGVPDTTFSNVMTNAEAVRLNPASIKSQLQAQRDILTRISVRDGA